MPSWSDDLLDQLSTGKRTFRMDPVHAVLHSPPVNFGPVVMEWVFKHNDIITHIFRGTRRRWPDEASMRKTLWDVLGQIVVLDNVSATYDEEVDAWSVRLEGYGNKRGDALEALTVGFGNRLVEALEKVA